MATRDDVVVDFSPSPRIAIVESPSTEFNMQDVVDTLRLSEETFRGQSESKLLNASGKEDLGGGVSVGITVQLQDCQIAFEGRTTPAQTGTVTADSTTPVGDSYPRKGGLIQLFDTNAQFITNNIQRGSLVINFTDQSIAEVYRVDSETVLTTRTLVNGIDNSFDIGDVYHIFNIEQCEVIGGNLVGVDENDASIIPVSPTAFTQVIRTASSSATLISASGTFPSAAENAQAVWDYNLATATSGSAGDVMRQNAFAGVIHVDTVNGVSGTAWPRGTEGTPVSNISDAVAIGITEGIYEIKIVDGNVNVLASDSISNFTIVGQSPEKTQVTVAAGATTAFCEFRELALSGTMAGRIFVDNCFVRDGLTNFQGTMQETLLGGVISLVGTTPCYFLSCYSDDTGSPLPEPIFNFGGTGPDLIMREYSGEVRLINKTNDSRVSISFISGGVTIDSSVTGGIFNFQGVYGLTNQSGGSPGITLVQNTNLDTIEIKVDNVQDTSDAILVSVSNFGAVIDDLIKYQRNRSLIDPVNFTLTIFDDDGVTPLTIFNLYDENGVASCTSVFERVPVIGSPGAP